METIGVYQAACRMKIPVMGIRVISDNEILNEEYDRETAIEAQKITLEIVKKYIQKMQSNDSETIVKRGKE